MRLLLIIFSVFLVSCSSKMNIEKGTFQAIKPPNIYGNERFLTKDTNRTISYNANMGKNKTIPLPGIINYPQELAHSNLTEEPANINYRLIENTLGIQFYRTIKKDDNFYTGFGGGVQNFPYGILMFGYNGKFMEIGGATFLGLTIDNASYEGGWYYECGFMCSESDYVKYSDIKVLHPYAGLATHASFYWQNFSLNYAASLSNPWFIDKLPIPPQTGGQPRRYYNADISFYFPILIMQDIGISYTPYNIKYRLGVNQITGVKFPGQYWGLSVQVSYAF